MNRAERRRQQKESAKIKEPTYTLTKYQIQQLKQEAYDKAMQDVTILTLGIPIMVMREKYGWGSRKRLPDFAEALTDEFQKFAENNRTVREYRQRVFDLTGLRFELEDER